MGLVKFVRRPLSGWMLRARPLFASGASSVRHVSDATYFADPIDPTEEKFRKILIANRGEIACRIIRTCKRMGIHTVAVYSDADARSMHVRLADESVCVGPPPSSKSYLNMDAILEAVARTGAEAVHPGYGFLSENCEFAARLDKVGVVFIGPNSHAIDGMGDKIHSKQVAQKAGVPIIPGFDGVVSSPEHAAEIARSIGYPVMIKASAGGGGKGMRIAYTDQEAMDGFRMSSQEAASSFGDDRLLVEKFIEQPRHIEVQLLADKHGNAIHLNERECSIQRRNQKVIEEAPSPFVHEDLRREMGAKAVKLAQAVGYDSAGTVEFLMDKNREFYFLEMNTRLQVEHPITEYTTGVDLVHQMIRIAKGHPLKLTQDQIGVRGWSIESRVYAEDPHKATFGLPSIGRLSRYEEPTEFGLVGPQKVPDVRCDSGVTEGSDISIYYDPLICKLSSYGETRDEAIGSMIHALDSYVIRGVTHNIPLLRDVLTQEKFLSGEISTKFLPETYPSGFRGRSLVGNDGRDICAIAASLFIRQSVRARHFLNEGSESSLRVIKHEKIAKRRLQVTFTDQQDIHSGGDIQTTDTKSGTGQVTEFINAEIIDPSGPTDIRLHFESSGDEIDLPFSLINLAGSKLEIKLPGDKDPIVVQLIAIPAPGHIRLQFKGAIYDVRVYSERAADYLPYMPLIPEADTSRTVRSPMPGLVKGISCSVGQEVFAGQEVCVVEAMKMQNSLTVSNAGRIKAINCGLGDTVEEDQILVELE